MVRRVPLTKGGYLILEILLVIRYLTSSGSQKGAVVGGFVDLSGIHTGKHPHFNAFAPPLAFLLFSVIFDL